MLEFYFVFTCSHFLQLRLLFFKLFGLDFPNPAFTYPPLTYFLNLLILATFCIFLNIIFLVGYFDWKRHTTFATILKPVNPRCSGSILWLVNEVSAGGS